MAAPAAAALVLAALAALPCRGTGAESSSKTFNDPQTRLERSHPTINKVYEMLRAIPDTHNQALGNSNYSSFNLESSVNTEDNAKGFNVTYSDGRGAEESNISLKDGAQVVVRKVALDKRSRKRAVSVVRAEAVEVAAATTVTPSPLQADRRRRPGEAGSSAPLLNYIFDAYSNTHHQHPRNDSVFKPSGGSGIYVAAASELEALVGSTAHLDCKVDALHDKLVSWVRRKGAQEPMELLTTGTQQYTADDRYSARFIPPDIWRLQVRAVRPADAALYDCQLSAHPPRTARVTLRVPEVSVRIVDGAGAGVAEQVCELGSTAALRCEVRGLRMEGGPALLWHRQDTLLNDDTTRGGISVRTELGALGAQSVLRVARVRGADAGRYSCSVARAPPPAPPPAHVTLHVIKGESLAELHAGGAGRGAARAPLLALAAAAAAATLL